SRNGSCLNNSRWSTKSPPPRSARSIRKSSGASTRTCISKSGDDEACRCVADAGGQTGIGAGEDAPEPICPQRDGAIPVQAQVDADVGWQQSSGEELRKRHGGAQPRGSAFGREEVCHDLAGFLGDLEVGLLPFPILLES